MRDAPLFDWDNMKDNDDEMSRILSHFDSLIITINPCPDAPVPDRHPCQKGNEELCDDLQDYIELVNKLQRHTRCNPSYCLRSKDGQQYCRFGFPKDNVEHSSIHENDRGQPELITSRNDPYVNPIIAFSSKGGVQTVTLNLFLIFVLPYSTSLNMLLSRNRDLHFQKF